VRGKLFERVLKALLLAALCLTAYKGLVATPEIATNFFPERFYRGKINDAENSLIMKERHYDFNESLDKAVRVKLEELLASGKKPSPGSLVTEKTLRLAIEKNQAKRLRDADSVLLAREKLERFLRLEAAGWAMGLSCETAAGPGR
jgi:hypothetical protein